MKRFFSYILLSLSLLCFLNNNHSNAQIVISEGVELDKEIHDFGDILFNSGPVSCSFIVKNNSNKAVVIYQVVSSCGCTDVSWTREPIRPGSTGKITAKYSNDEAPIPFDKNLTVYFSDVKKPKILKLRGVCVEKELSLKESFPTHLGRLGIKKTEINVGQIEQGKTKSEKMKIANISDKDLKIDFTEVSNGLSISIIPSVIPPQSTAEIVFSITPDRKHWGKNKYYATAMIDEEEICRFKALSFNIDNFSTCTKEDKKKGSKPIFDSSTYSFGKRKLGSKITAEFNYTNQGESCFAVYKCDTDARSYSHSDILPVKPGERGSFRVHIDTSLMPKGETLVIVSLTTNSPIRPIVNLFITGYLE